MEFPKVTFLSSRAETQAARSPRQLSADYAAGRLVRLRRGIYLPTDEWLGGTAHDRYAITTASLAVAGRSPVLCRETALLAWGVELARLPSHVRYRTPHRSKAGEIPVGALYGNTAKVLQTWGRRGKAAGSGGPLPAGFPDARHLGGGTSKRLLLAHLGLALAIEPFDDVIADTLHRLPFAEAVVVADAILARRPGLKAHRTADQLDRLASAMANASALARTMHVLGFADGASESVGESLSRALMWELGFEVPQLQVWITKDGRRIARVDYCWPRIKLAGEFDGLTKYLRSRELSGKPAEQVLVEEKRREDEIRSVGYGMVRWVWSDLLEPARFATILHRAGVPRRR